MLDQSTVFFDAEERGDVHTFERTYECIGSAFVSCHGNTEFRLFQLAFLTAECGDQIVSCLRICCVCRSCPAKSVVERASLAFIAGAVSVSIIVGNLSPCVICSVLCGVESRGMILASGSDDNIKVIFASADSVPGQRVH